MRHSRIFITGASSGIGEALARVYAAQGVTLGLAARRLDRLEVLKIELEGQSNVNGQQTKVYIYRLDVTDGAAVQRVAREFVKAAGGIDLVIANAGVAGWGHPVHDDVGRMTQMIEVNVIGVINTIASFVKHMQRGKHGHAPSKPKAKRGHAVAVSSIASFKSLPGGVYSASKAAVRYLMDGWRADLAEHGIGVTTIFPGFVSSEITRGEGWYPFLISAEQAARQIKRAIAAERTNVIIPWQWRFIVPFVRLLPPEFFAWFRKARDRKYHTRSS